MQSVAGRGGVAALVLLASAVAAAAGQGELQASGQRLTLGAAIAEALDRSPHLDTSYDEVAAAEIRQSVASARFHPKLTPNVTTGTAPGGAAQRALGVSVSQLLATGATVQGSTSMTRYGSGPSALNDAGFTIGVSQPLLRGFGVVARAEVDAAVRATSVAESAAVDARRQLVVRVAQAYFAVVREQRLEAEAAMSLERAVKLHEMSEARARVGLSTRLDVYRAGLLESQSQAVALRTRDGLERAREDLNLLLGRPANEPVLVDADVAAVIDALPQAELTSDAPATLEVMAARARLDDARRSAAVTKWNSLPNVNLDVSYTKRGFGAGSGLSLDQLNGWRVGFSTTHGFDAGADAASSALAAISVRAAERRLADAEQRAALAANRASRAVARARDSIALQETSVELAEQQRELAAMRYERGLADNLEVIDAESRLFQAQSARIGAEIDLAIALLDMQRVSGTLNPDRVLR